MKKLALASIVILSGCDSHSLPPQPVVIQQPAVVQPQVIQQPAPVVIQQAPNNNAATAVTSFAAGAALGALAGHVATKEMDKPKTPVTEQVKEVQQLAEPSKTPSSMDMSKLAQPKLAASPLTQKMQTSSAMDMNKLGKHSIAQTVTPLPGKKVDMSKLSAYGKR